MTGVDAAGLSVDLNSDVGEGRGDDEAMLRVVTSASIACGFHAGDATTMRRVCRLAAVQAVSAGAHPGFNDREGFGRRRIAGEPAEAVADMVLYQVGALQAIANREGVDVTHVKLHGALSNQAAEDMDLADAVAAALAGLGDQVRWLIPAGSAMAVAAARHGVPAVSEAFADRAYDAAGNLVSRDNDGAVLERPEEVAERAVLMVTEGGVRTAGGDLLRLPVESICVHGDTPGAAASAAAVRAALIAAGVTVAAF